MDNVSITPGLSGHYIVVTQVNVTPEVTKQVLRNIPFYKNADWDQLKQSMRDVYFELKQTDLATTNVPLRKHTAMFHDCKMFIFR